MVSYRQEEKKDKHNAEQTVREAFWNKYMPGCVEHYLVHILREKECFIPELAFVGEKDSQIVGAVYYTKIALKTNKGKEYICANLGPVAVLPDLQNQGVGAGLIGITKQICKMIGYKCIFLVGDVNYYSRFGFVQAEKFGIKYGEDFFPKFLCCELEENFLKDKEGSAIEDEAFNIDYSKVNTFNTSFPRKEKLVLPTQIFDENGNFIGDKN